MKIETPSLKESFELFSRFFHLIKPYWGRLLKVMSLGPILTLIGIVIPYFSKLLIDQAYPLQSFSLMQTFVFGILVLSIASTLIGAFQGYLGLKINVEIENTIGLKFFNHIQHLKIRFFEDHQVGEIMSRFSDVNKSLNSINKALQTIFMNGIYVILIPALLFVLQWKLAIISIITFPLIIVLIILTGKYLRKYWEKSAEAYSKVNAFQFEMLAHINSLKSMVLEYHVYTETKKLMTNAMQLKLKAGRLNQKLGMCNGILNSLNMAFFTWYSWTLILSQHMSLGDYIAFSTYLGFLYRPLSEFISFFSEFQQSAINLRRTFEYLDYPTEIIPQSSIIINSFKIIQPLTGDIEVKDLTFSYNKEIPVLQNVNLKIEQKSIVSIIGSNGSGKTTLLKLLIGMDTPNNGDILYDGKSISQFPLHQLRKQITVIWQEFSLFKGSILDNLLIGKENISKSEIRRALKLTKLNDLIGSLPLGLDTQIAEWGATLSAGQKQRLAIARAIIRNTPIIIFDEATSNIDLKTEEEILKNLINEEKDNTLIFVTHRINPIMLTNKICLIESGKILGYGTHDQLIHDCEYYKRMRTYNIYHKINFQPYKP